MHISPKTTIRLFTFICVPCLSKNYGRTRLWQNIKFEGEVEKRLALSDFLLPQYSRKDIAEKGWIEVGKKMNLPGKCF